MRRGGQTANEVFVQPHFRAIISEHMQQSGAVEACWAHNPEVRRSKLRSAMHPLFHRLLKELRGTGHVLSFLSVNSPTTHDTIHGTRDKRVHRTFFGRFPPC